MVDANSGRTYREDIWCVMKHLGVANVHVQETLQKIYRNEPTHKSIPLLENKLIEVQQMRKNLIGRWGKTSKQEDYSCPRCDEDLGAQLRNTYKEKEENTIIDSSDVKYDIYKEYKSEDNNMLDKAVATVSKKTGISTDVIKGGVLGGGLGYITDMGLDIPLSTTGAKIAKVGLGLFSIGSLVALKNKLGNVGRSTLFFNGIYLTYRGIDPTMADIKKMIADMKAMGSSFKSLNFQSVKEILTRSRDKIAEKIPIPQITKDIESEEGPIETLVSPSYSPSQSKGYDKIKIF